jgi:hypothetical protein
MQAVHSKWFVISGFTLILWVSAAEAIFIQKVASCKGHIMTTIAQFFSNLLTRQNNSAEACSLLERAATARGLSQDDATQLRINALAMLSVVR